MASFVRLALDAGARELVVPRALLADRRHRLEALRGLSLVAMRSAAGWRPVQLRVWVAEARRQRMYQQQWSSVEKGLLPALLDERDARVEALAGGSADGSWQHRNRRFPGGRVVFRPEGVRPGRLRRTLPWSDLRALRFEARGGLEQLYLVFGRRWVELNALPQERLRSLGERVRAARGIGEPLRAVDPAAHEEDRHALLALAREHRRKLVAVLLLLLGASLATTGFFGWRWQARHNLGERLLAEGHATTGTVAARRDNVRIPTEDLLYRFTVDGRIVGGEVEVFFWTGPGVGEPIRVLYDPEEPGSNVWAGQWADATERVLASVGAVLTVLLVGLAATELLRARARARALRSPWSLPRPG